MDKVEGTITQRYQKVIMGLVIGVLFIGGLLLFLWRYSNVLSGMSQQVVKNPLQQDAVLMTQIKEDYEANFPRILGNYLKTDVASSDFATLTAQTKDQLLALKVPGAYKDSHLSTVLILSDIESLLAKGDAGSVVAKISQLQKIAQSFPSI